MGVVPASDEQRQALAVDLQARLDDMGLILPALAARIGTTVARLRPYLKGREPSSPLGDRALRKMAEVLAVRPQVLIARVAGEFDGPLTSTDPLPAVTVPEDDPAGRVAVMWSRLKAPDQRMVEQLIVRLLGE